MNRMFRYSIVVTCCVLFSASGVLGKVKQSKVMDALKVLPVKANILIMLDINSTLKTYENWLKSMSDEARRELLSNTETNLYEILDSAFRKTLGIDLKKTGIITVALSRPSDGGLETEFEIIISNIMTEDLKGKKIGVFRNHSIYLLEKESGVFYSQLNSSNVVIANNREALENILKKELDQDPQSINLFKNSLVAKLMSESPSFDQARALLLSADVPEFRNLPFRLNEGGIFMKLGRGFSVVLYSDVAGAEWLHGMTARCLRKIKKDIWNILHQQDKHGAVPDSLYTEDELSELKVAVNLAGKIKTIQEGGRFELTYRGTGILILLKVLAPLFWKTLMALNGEPSRKQLKNQCESGGFKSCYELGLMWGNGQDGPIGIGQARKWIQKACELNYKKACDFLPMMIESELHPDM